MNQDRRWRAVRLLAGSLLGALLAPAAVWFLGLGQLADPQMLEAAGSAWTAGAARGVTAQMAEAFGSAGLAALVQSLLGAVFGAVVAAATLPFAEDGRELVLRSLVHFGATAASFSALLWICRWVTQLRFVLLWVALLAVLYGLIWLGRWIGWYMEVAQLRVLLGLDPGPSPLKWRETLPYMVFALFACGVLPALLWGVLGAMLGSLINCYILLPLVCFCSGLSLGKRYGVCPLYPAVCGLALWPVVGVLYHIARSACLIPAAFALMGNVTGWLYRRAVPKRRPASRPE